MESADRILLVVDGSDTSVNESKAGSLWPEKDAHLSRDIPVTIIHNKCDLASRDPLVHSDGESVVIELSARTGAGMDLLRQHLKSCMGYEEGGEGRFSARRRHLQSLEAAQAHLLAGQTQLLDSGAGELLADDLRQCQNSLGEITGTVSSDDLLGEIFSSFCIGK
jgi:tRNA modification GTPase